MKASLCAGCFYHVWCLLTCLIYVSADVSLDPTFKGSTRLGFGTVVPNTNTTSGSIIRMAKTASGASALISSPAKSLAALTTWQSASGPFQSPYYAVSLPSNPNCYRATSDGTQVFSVNTTNVYGFTTVATSTTNGWQIPASPGIVIQQCLDFAPGRGGAIGMAAMITTTSQLIVFKKASNDNSLQRSASFSSDVTFLSLTEEPLAADYSVVRYYIGTSTGAIVTVLASNGVILQNNTQSIIPLGFINYNNQSLVTALYWVNTVLHVGGQGVYTTLDTSNPLALFPSSGQVWADTLHPFSDVFNITFIRNAYKATDGSSAVWLT